MDELQEAIQTLEKLQDVERKLLTALTDGPLADVPALSASQKKLYERLSLLTSNLLQPD